MMKKKIFNIFLVLLIIFSSAGCKKYLDLNDNPNTVDQPPINGLLAYATFNTAVNQFRVSQFTSYFVQYLANPGSGGATDTYQEVDYSGTWGRLYDVMANITDMEKLAIEQGSSEHLGVAKVLMAINLSTTVDAWGSVPYSQAFTGESLTPAYDTGEQIYPQILQMLDEAIVELEKTDSKVNLEPGSDFIHGGSREKWIKTAYAMKARLLNHYSKDASYNPAAILTALSSAYTSNADDAQVTSFKDRNPWAGIALNDSLLVLNGWLSEQIIDHMNGTSYSIVDPRLPRMASKTITNTYKGTPNGGGNVGNASNTVIDESRLRRSTFYASENAPLFIITYPETKFIEAEAALRSNNPTVAYAAYLEGIRAHMDKVGVAAADRDAYLAEPSVAPGQSGLTINLIMKEKYVAMFLSPEAWVDARRYNYQYKDFSLPMNAALSEYIRRVTYPSTETTRNRENVPAVQVTDRIFWDK